MVTTFLLALVLAVAVVPDDDRRRQRIRGKSQLREEYIMTPDYIE